MKIMEQLRPRKSRAQLYSFAFALSPFVAYGRGESNPNTYLRMRGWRGIQFGAALRHGYPHQNHWKGEVDGNLVLRCESQRQCADRVRSSSPDQEPYQTA